MTVLFSFARVPPIHCGTGTLKEITAWLRSLKADQLVFRNIELEEEIDQALAKSLLPKQY